MRWLVPKSFGIAGGVVWVLFFALNASATKHNDHPYRHSDLDIPVSLAAGTIRTPDFPVVSEWYDIMVQVEKPLPFQRMVCMMGVGSGMLTQDACSSNDPLLRADWVVLDGGRIVDHGSVPNRCACKFESKYIYKFLGSFVGEAGRRYEIQVKFTKDATPLNVANPHLIIILQKYN
jgi:hypothetical protein